MKKLSILLFAMLLTGCGTMQTSVQTVKVAVPVPCDAEVPSRPIMPTDAVPLDLPRDRFAFELGRAALAEIEVRQGYEDRLLAALKSCL